MAPTPLCREGLPLPQFVATRICRVLPPLAHTVWGVRDGGEPALVLAIKEGRRLPGPGGNKGFDRKVQSAGRMRRLNRKGFVEERPWG